MIRLQTFLSTERKAKTSPQKTTLWIRFGIRYVYLQKSTLTISFAKSAFYIASLENRNPAIAGRVLNLLSVSHTRLPTIEGIYAKFMQNAIPF
ncbi:hypothetical protein [Serratia rubidaea]|uniref:Uncharacterized protein n=1 Tax=Serratia rubidaea TaxID=61652 RepID=A0ABS0MHN4_SERRU|nr:hypothetical protein [Serratia rubidaea]MBH1930892.1 hypothetical protein [Serratia rubidaea]